jgi:DNA-binding response OmpR family regulator
MYTTIQNRMPTGGESIFIVDDDPDTCELLELLFKQKGYQALIAHSGQEALERLQDGEPDALILDVMMPAMDGWDFYCRLREFSQVPVLFLTGLASGENATRALNLGASDFVRKPFHPGELLARISTLLQSERGKILLSEAGFANQGYVTRPKVSVVIPTLNEAQNLPLVLPHLPLDWIDEVILVDGRSKDGTVETARALLPSIKVVLETLPGKGAAMQAGFQASTGEIIIVLDADGSHDPREIPLFISRLVEGADFVKGSRFAIGGGTTDMPRYRKLGNSALTILVNLLFNVNFTDLCYGYLAFWRDCLESIDMTGLNGFEIDAAIYTRAASARLRLVEVPSFEGYRFHGLGKLRSIPDGLRILRTILREWQRSWNPSKQKAYLGFRNGRRELQELSPVVME